MKPVLLYTGIGIPLTVFVSLLALHTWIGRDVKTNIQIAQEKYPGSPEQALIQFLQDELNTFHDRTHVAVWTLGQLESETALPVLREYYRDDPLGKTCLGRHDSVLCQYELHKAIRAIEKGRFFSHAGLKE